MNNNGDTARVCEGGTEDGTAGETDVKAAFADETIAGVLGKVEGDKESARIGNDPEAEAEVDAGDATKESTGVLALLVYL